jgi:orotate phosphoribosyltransferase
MALFFRGNMVLHAGQTSNFKIDCDRLSHEDINTLAFLISERYKFSKVIGVPRGGILLAASLKKYLVNDDSPALIVDDVLTTGASMEAARSNIKEDSRGVVIFARGRCPWWVEPIFQMWSQADGNTERE